MERSSAWVVIPAYQPEEEQMIKLVQELQEKGFSGERIVVINDGSGGEWIKTFERIRLLGARVFLNQNSRGKGAALKTGINYAIAQGGGGVITCDADGKYASQDVAALADEGKKHPEALILGVRSKGREGIICTLSEGLARICLGWFSGMWVKDMASGLRVLPGDYLAAYASLPEDGYGYETAMLYASHKMAVKLIQLPLQTPYFANRDSIWGWFTQVGLVLVLLLKRRHRRLDRLRAS